MGEFSVGDRVLVPGVVGACGSTWVNVQCGRAQVVHLNVDDLRPDTGGRDQTAQDVLDAWAAEEPFGMIRRAFADRLNRIARGGAGSAGDDTAPPAALPVVDAVDRAITDLTGQPQTGAAYARAFVKRLAEYGVEVRAAAGPRAGDTGAAVTLPLDELFWIKDWADDRASWRCLLGKSTLDEGYTSGACRYDHNCDSRTQAQAQAREHLRVWHQLAGRAGDTAPDDDYVARAARQENRVSEMRRLVIGMKEELDRLRSEAAELRGAGNNLAAEVEARDTAHGPLARDVQRWRSAAGGETR